jgi:hypothetical protein
MNPCGFYPIERTPPTEADIAEAERIRLHLEALRLERNARDQRRAEILEAT